ncbi:MAG: hypothetical protein ACT4OT_13060 [Acidobacteriota bacterium]
MEVDEYTPKGKGGQSEAKINNPQGEMTYPQIAQITQIQESIIRSV